MLPIRGCHPSRPASQLVLVTFTARLVPVRSPLLGEYLLISFPTGTEMFQFPAFALETLCIQVSSTWFCSLSSPRRCAPNGPRVRAERALRSNNNKQSGGLPHSEIPGSKDVLASPGLIAEYHVLHRLLLPRHPPNALLALDPIQKKTGPFACGRGSKAFAASEPWFRPQPVPRGKTASDHRSDPVSPVPPGRKSLTRWRASTDAPRFGSPERPRKGPDRQSRSVY
jgi:hypothetical protein